MRLGVGICVCALALLPHSGADSSTFTYGSGSGANQNNVAARSEIEASSDSTARKSKNSVTVKSITRWIAQLEFPKAIFTSYYKEPSLEQQPQPIVHDEYSNSTFPSNLTDPAYIKLIVPNPVNFPYPYLPSENIDPTTVFYQSIDIAAGIINGSTGLEGNCTRCVAVITAGQDVARFAPGNFSDALIRLCKTVGFKTDADCERDYAKNKPEPAMWAQVLQGADVLGNDGLLICNAMFGQTWCDKPPAVKPNLIFGVEKPANATSPQPSGKRVKVLHLSDVHLDPRYTVGAEAVNCPEGGCCRTDPNNVIAIKNPAPFNGHPNCDTPFSLLASALWSVSGFSGKDTQDPIEWTLFSGDLMPRENPKYRNDKYLAFVQSAVYKVMKYFLPQGPVYPVLGALDAFNEEPSIQHPLIGDMKDLQTNNYNRMRTIIDANQWLSKDESAAIVSNRMGYTAKHPKYPKLRIIALNTNFWSLQNYYTYVNSTSPRESMILSGLIDWLLLAEEAQERVWIVGHIPPFAGQALPNHSEAFYQVMERFTPHVIAGVFFGHLHTDSISIFYKDGGKDVTREDNVVITSWLAPSLSPKSGNPSYKVYEVDTGDFRIYESRTYYTNSSNLANTSLPQANATTNSNGQNGSSNGLLWELACDAREVYGKTINWPSTSPLNAAFWHRVGNAMLQSNASDQTNLAAKYHMYKSTSIDGKGVTGKCDAACISSTVCRMRAAKESLWEQCGSDEVQKDAETSNASVYTTKNGDLSSTTATPTKRSVDSEVDLEIDINIEYGNSGIDNGGNEEQQANIQKRRGPGFWSMASSKAGQKAQDHGTSTKTMTVSSNQGGSSSIAKRHEDSDSEGIRSIAAPVEARFADPAYSFTEDILPAETGPMTGLWGFGDLSGAMTAAQGIASTGYQLLNQVISAQSEMSLFTIVRPTGATPARARGRDLTASPQGPMETASSAIVGDDENPSNSGDDAAGIRSFSEQSEGHSHEGQTLTDGAQVPDQNLGKRRMGPADAPDTTTTASSNEPTDGVPGGVADQPWDFPIYRPDESMNGQILRRRPSGGSDSGAFATSTQANLPTEGQGWPELAPTALSSVNENFDPLASTESGDMVAKRDEKREPGCSTYTSYSVCSSTVTYVEYSPEQSTQILSAYLSGASRYNALMATIARKTTSKWSTFTINFSPKATVSATKRDVPTTFSNTNENLDLLVSAASGDDIVAKREENRTPGCSTFKAKSTTYKVCSSSVRYLEFTPEQSSQLDDAMSAGPLSYDDLRATMTPKTTSKWQTWTQGMGEGFDAPPPTSEIGHTSIPSPVALKRDAIPDPSAGPDPNMLLDLWIKQAKIRSYSSLYSKFSTDTSWIEDYTWVAKWEHKRTAEPVAEPEPTAMPDSEALSKLVSLWESRASVASAKAAATQTDPADVKRSAEPEPEAVNKLVSLWESRLSVESAKSEAAKTASK